MSNNYFGGGSYHDHGSSSSSLVSDDRDDADAAESVASEETIEPDDDKANALKFSDICKRMETLWRLKRNKKKKVPDSEKKMYILPPVLLRHLEHQSVFPLFRLLLPDIDNSRNTFMKEKLIAQAYCDAEGFAKGTTNYDMLYGFTDPQKVPHNMAGDLSLVVQHVLEKRIPNKPSTVTVGQMNSLLDDLAAIRYKQRYQHNHQWRDNNNNNNNGSNNSSNNFGNGNTVGNQKKKKKESLVLLREQWLRKVMAKGLSPLEHKWLVRMLLEKMEFGLGWRAILTWYNKYAIELWNTHNSLKNLCNKLADPQYTIRRERQEELRESVSDGIASRWEPQAQPAALGNTISPMLSSRVSFENCMTQLQFNHKEFLKTSTHDEVLALRNPAVCAEIKLDGERMLVHVKNGLVTMQTRNGKWYSQLYSPALGPPIRKALEDYNVNVILDGEVLAWDDGRQEVVPFGSNRTVAKYRRDYLRRRKMLDPRDKNLHANDQGLSVVPAADEYKFVKPYNDDENVTEDPGKDCWLQYIIFDILYVGGPDASKVFQECNINKPNPGSIIDLPTLLRKQILYRLLKEQPKQVELCDGIVIRPNGDSVLMDEYFDTRDPIKDGQHSIALLDSTQFIIEGKVENLDLADRRQRGARSNIDISRARSQAVGEFYRQVVDVHRMEGLVIKDLAAPYIFGGESKGRKYWHKFKPDYEKSGGAVDIDVVILGAYYATGLRNAGKLSHFLCGCLDSDNPSLFMPFCNVTGAVGAERLDKIMETTGFAKATQDGEVELGKWFEEESHRESLPSFISTRSFQQQYQQSSSQQQQQYSQQEDNYGGWKFNRNKNYPDLWIHPEDSVVLTVRGQELVLTEDYSTGITIRFARITRIRDENIDGDEKNVAEIDTDEDLWHIYSENMKQRQELSASLDGSQSLSIYGSQGMFHDLSQQQYQTVGGGASSGGGGGTSTSRFLTPEEYGRKAAKRKRKASNFTISKVPKVEHPESRALHGLSFVVLEGRYSLDKASSEAKEAMEGGWLDEAMKIKTKEHLMKYIQLHGGIIMVSMKHRSKGGRDDDDDEDDDEDDEGKKQEFVLGGNKKDARVVQYIKAIDSARARLTTTTTTTTSTTTSITTTKKSNSRSGNSRKTTKKELQLQRIAQRPGVLKWIFPFILVNKWKKLVLENSKQNQQNKKQQHQRKRQQYYYIEDYDNDDDEHDSSNSNDDENDNNDAISSSLIEEMKLEQHRQEQQQEDMQGSTGSKNVGTTSTCIIYPELHHYLVRSKIQIQNALDQLFDINNINDTASSNNKNGTISRMELLQIFQEKVIPSTISTTLTSSTPKNSASFSSYSSSSSSSSSYLKASSFSSAKASPKTIEKSLPWQKQYQIKMMEQELMSTKTGKTKMSSSSNMLQLPLEAFQNKWMKACLRQEKDDDDDDQDNDLNKKKHKSTYVDTVDDNYTGCVPFLYADIFDNFDRDTGALEASNNIHKQQSQKSTKKRVSWSQDHDMDHSNHDDGYYNGIGGSGGLHEQSHELQQHNSNKPKNISQDVSHRVLSVLPLARSMGAIITSDINQQTVTYILCDLIENNTSRSDEDNNDDNDDNDGQNDKMFHAKKQNLNETKLGVKIKYVTSLQSNIFHGKERGERLLEYLKKRLENNNKKNKTKKNVVNNDDTYDIRDDDDDDDDGIFFQKDKKLSPIFWLVSPSWIRSRWNDTMISSSTSTSATATTPATTQKK